MTAFEKAWDVVKNDITWDHIWLAGKLKEAGGGPSELIKLIRRLDSMGASYSAERKAVDLMLNSGWRVKETQDRMGQTSQGNRTDTSIDEGRVKGGFLNPVDWAEVDMDEEAEGVSPRLTGDDDDDETMFREEFE
jgi:hypothetical protein